MWRVIARVGYTDDQVGAGSLVASAMRNHVANILQGAGFVKTRTGTWEAPAVDETAAANALSSIILDVAQPSGIPGTGPNNHLKHLWLYIDSDGPPTSSGIGLAAADEP